MTLAKSLLLGSVTAFAAVAGAQAADLPSRKSAPVNYVKICDAYGAGFFFIPGTDTCLKVGGYVRAEWQYTPAQSTITVSGGGVPALTAIAGSQDTTGTEVRGRVDLDARTPTALGTVRTSVRLRAANTSGIRNSNNTNNANITFSTASATGITIEQAMVQWAGFTFGVAPENYAMMPSQFYTANAWAGFPNGMKQIAYTATFGGGFSATIAIEDRTDWGYVPTAAAAAPSTTYNHTPLNGYALVGNLRVDQSWGFAAVHGVVNNNSIRSDGLVNATALGIIGNAAGNGGNGNANPLVGSQTKTGWGIGATAKFNLPMIAAGDAIWITANYANGHIGALLSNGGLNQLANASGKRFLGGIQRTDQNLYVTSGTCTVANTCTIGTATGWNIAAAATHYWTPQWRSNFSAGYVEINPPTVSATANGGGAAAMQWGKGRTWEVRGSLIYSPAKNFDIGLEVQYMNMKNNVQNPTAAFIAAGSPGLSRDGVTTHLRIERSF